MKMSLVLILAASGALVSCVTVDPIIGPDDNTNQLISCPAVEMCYEKAHEICNGPYRIVNTSSDSWGANGSSSTTVKLLIKCGQ